MIWFDIIHHNCQLMRNSESIFEKYIAMLYSCKYSYLHLYKITNKKFNKIDFITIRLTISMLTSLLV